MNRFLPALVLALFLLGGAAVAQPRALAIDAWSCEVAAVPSGSPVAPVGATPIAFPEDAGELVVFAAASLTDAFGEIEANLESTYPGLEVTNNFGGSQALVTQLTEGAPADVAALASNAAMTSAIEAGVIDGEPEKFVENILTIVVPTDNPAGVDSAEDLTQNGLKLVLAAEDVPAGQYARASVCQMGADPATYGEDFVARVAANVVSEEDNVRAVLTKVALGEADAGIVYTSDVSEDVVAIEIPDAVNVLASYPIAAVTGGNTEAAAAYISYILSPEGQAILESYGFIPVG